MLLMFGGEAEPERKGVVSFCSHFWRGVSGRNPRSPARHREEFIVVTKTELDEYLDQIRKDVCGVCVERPPEGPPCGPAGKQCGIEIHLREIIDSIHGVRSDLIEPYLRANRKQICESCTLLHSGGCRCPMDYLSVLL